MFKREQLTPYDKPMQFVSVPPLHNSRRDPQEYKKRTERYVNAENGESSWL